jgi:hypothetical protein
MKLDVKEIPVSSKWKHPPPASDVLPKHEFTIGIIGKLNFISYIKLLKVVER